MKKRLLALFLALLFVLPSAVISFAENPTSLEAPLNVAAREDDGSIKLRWTVPQSILRYAQESEGELLYSVDWKMNNGPWQNSGAINEASLEKDTEQTFYGYVSNIVSDETDVMEIFFVYFHFGLEETLDLANNTYSFRVRFAFNDYNQDDENFVLSAFSNEASVGKSIQGVAPSKLDTPTNLKVETKKDEDGKPYFYLNWTNPASVDTADKNVPIAVKVDFKVGNGPWHSEQNGHDWWTGDEYSTSVNFDPVEKEYVDRVVIEENTYYFRILYAYEPTYGNKVYSSFSNIVSAGVPAFEGASSWAMPDLVKGEELGIITDTIDGKMNAPITRQEFAEVAVKFYEMVTGKTAVPHPTKTFTDCTNADVLKAFNLQIVAGVGDGTKFEPNSPLLRQQMAAMITRAIKACYPEVVFDVAGMADFKDQKLIAAYANTPTKFMAKYKITVGDGKGSFIPNDNCTREQAVAFLVRAFNYKDQYLPK